MLGWHVSLIHLKRTLHALHQAQEGSQDQDQDGYPKRVPLYPVTPVVPPLGDGPRRRIVVGLLQDHEPVPPIREVLDLPLLHLQVAAVRQSHVQHAAVGLPQSRLPEPLPARAAAPAPELGFGQEKCQCTQDFVDQTIWEKGTAFIRDVVEDEKLRVIFDQQEVIGQVVGETDADPPIFSMFQAWNALGRRTRSWLSTGGLPKCLARKSGKDPCSHSRNRRGMIWRLTAPNFIIDASRSARLSRFS
ncbi:hypothetical protein PG995_014444 [Apiospora arundinis]